MGTFGFDILQALVNDIAPAAKVWRVGSSMCQLSPIAVTCYVCACITTLQRVFLSWQPDVPSFLQEHSLSCKQAASCWRTPSCKHTAPCRRCQPACLCAS
jgi:hypothetical protein